MVRTARHVSAMLLLVICAAASRAADVDALRAANNLYDAGDYAAALEAYESMLEAGEDGTAAAVADAEVLFNRGCALYQLGRLDEAAAAFEQAAALGDPELQAAAQRNLGLTHQQRAARALSGEAADPTEAIAALEASEQALRQAADLAPGDAAPIRSLERVRRQLQTLRQMAQPQPPQQSQTGEGQPQQQSQPDQPQSGEGSQGDPGQQQPGGEGQSGGQQANGQQQPSSPPDDAGPTEEMIRQALEQLAEQQQQVGDVTDQISQLPPDVQEEYREQIEQLQQQIRERTDAVADAMPPDQPDEAQLDEQTAEAPESPDGAPESDRVPTPRERVDEARRRQEAAQRALEQRDLQGAAEQQQAAAEALRDAAMDMAEASDGEPSDPTETEESAAMEQAEATEGEPQDATDADVAAILDKEERDRERRESARKTGRSRAVTKDW
jgi:tetratricopeptide (TPR) repeat protein